MLDQFLSSDDCTAPRQGDEGFGVWGCEIGNGSLSHRECEEGAWSHRLVQEASGRSLLVRRGCLEEDGHRDGTHHLMAFCGHLGSRTTMRSGDPVSEQSSKPAEMMMGKRKARKEEALPRAHARRMQHIIPGTEVGVSMAVPGVQPDLPDHVELKHRLNLPACEARCPRSARAMANRRQLATGWRSAGGRGRALAQTLLLGSASSHPQSGMVLNFSMSSSSHF